MKLIAFPARAPSPQELAELAALEAALDGDGTGPEAESWRELRAEVRELAEPIDPVFERTLRQRLHAAQPPARRRLDRVRAAISNRPRRALAATAAAVALTGAAGVGVAALTVAHSNSGPVAEPAKAEHTSNAQGTFNTPAVEEPASNRVKGDEKAAGASAVVAGDRQSTLGARRLQELGASISLGAGSAGVQQLAARVGQLAVAAGGYVESSRVQLQRGTSGEALMTLQIPSAKLATTLAQLERIAPVRAETQSLQDVTGEYNAASARVSAARSERSALLRALAGATTAAAIESLHARIAQASREIASAERQRAGISRRASKAQVEVTVLGEAAHSGGLTVSRGLHDAGHVLGVMLAVLLIAAAVLLPLALAVAALALASRYRRRQRRERVLDSR